MNVEDIYGLSPMQTAMLLRGLEDEGSPAYLVQQLLRIRDGLDEERLQDAWYDVIEKHDVFRTIFANLESKEAKQVVLEEMFVPWEEVRLQGDEPLEDELEEVLAADKRKPLDVERGPLMRITRISSTEGQFLLWTYHHALLDGWSVPLVFADLAKAYGGEPGPFTQTTGQYGDYIRWLELQDRDAAIAHWDTLLSMVGGPSRISPRVDAERSQTTPVSRQISAKLPSSVGDALSEIARRNQVTISTVVQSAWAVLVALYSAQQTVAFGSVVSGRPPELDGVERIVGPFLNTVPVVVDIDPDGTFQDVLAAIHRQQLDRLGFEYLPLTEVQKLAPIPAGASLFDSVFIFENYPIDQKADNPLGLSFEKMALQTDMPISMTAWITDQLYLDLKFGSSSSREFAGELIDRFAGMLRALAETEEGAIPVASILPQGTLDALRPLTRGEPLAHDAIADVAARVFEFVSDTPDSIAVVSGNSCVSYRALGELADGVADNVAQCGAGPGDRVAVLMRNSAHYVAAMLGIWRAGACVVPLDISHPDDHLARLLQDCDATAVVTDQDALETASAHALPVLEISRGETVAALPERSVLPDQLAYVIYTSGSTGDPKGVMIPHRALGTYLASAMQTFAFDRETYSVVLSSFAFDLCLTSLLPPLLCGGTLCLALVDEEQFDLDVILERLPANSLLKLTPSHLRMLAPFATAGGGLRLGTIVSGGEKLPGSLAASWQEAVPGLRLYNHYGPTEAAIGVCYHPVDPVGDDAGDLPIGRPMPGRQVYLLDGAGNLLPRFAVGEVHVGGAGLARGYLGRPGLTAERFVPDPFSGDGGRLYRTGDLGRYLPDGSIEFLGRIDDQVKIRGFRIELGEIEAVLRAHPAVERAVASVHEPSPDQKMLVAYVKPADGEPFDQDALLAFLRRRLPAPMVPAALVRVDAFALTANGKLDRKALPDPVERGDGDAPAAPRDDRERQLVALWQDALGIEPVGIHDNFFEIGGDSIVIIQIVARAHRLGLKITPRQMAERQTIAELATVMSQAQAEATEAFTGPATLLPIQQRFFDTDRTDTDHFNPALVFRGKGLDAALLEAALAAIVQRHDVLRSRFERADDGSWRQVYGAEPPGGVLDELDLSALGEQERQQRMADAFAACQRDLDIARARLLRALLVRLPDGEDALLVTIHHLVVDAVSWRILIDDLERAYAQLEAGEPAALPPATTSPAIWAQRLESLAAGDALRELDFWQKQADTAPLPIAAADVPAKPVIHRLSLSEEETASLLRDVPRAHGAAINDILLTALARALAAHYATDRVAIELEGHGREDIFPDLDLSQSVGWFTSMYPVLLKLDPDDDIDRSVRSIRRQLARVPKGGIGYGALRYMSADRGTACSLENLPHPAISFNYLGQFNQARDEGTRFAIAQDPADQYSLDTVTSASRDIAIGVIVSVHEKRLKIVCIEPEDAREATVFERLVLELRNIIAESKADVS